MMIDDGGGDNNLSSSSLLIYYCCIYIILYYYYTTKYMMKYDMMTTTEHQPQKRINEHHIRKCTRTASCRILPRHKQPLPALRFKSLNNTMSKKEVLASFRKLLRAGSKCSDYNYRNFILRRIREDFRENKDVAQTHVPALLQTANQQIDYIQRVVTVQNLYAQPNSVMDHLK